MTDTTTPRHTPRPWTVRCVPGCYGTYQIKEAAFRERWDLAKRGTDEYGEPSDLPAERHANARLIAAAPDLLASLREIVSFVQCDWLTPNTDEEEREELLAQVREAAELLARIDGDASRG